MKVEGPFVDWPPNLLEEVMEALYAKRSGLKHLIHLVIQPQMTSFSIKAQFSIFDKSRLEYCIFAAFFRGCRIWQYGLWSFQMGDTKLEKILPKNQHTKRK